MTLGFSTHIKGKPTHFVGKIWSGLVDNPQIVQANYLAKELMHINHFMPSVEKGYMSRVERTKPKLHTIRTDKKGRWKPGNKIHFVVKNRTPDRFQFAPVVLCKSVQRIEINHRFGAASLEVLIDGDLFGQYHYGYDENINDEGLLQLALNDGFKSIEDFSSYFKEDFEGVIIHWTDLTYCYTK